ncbi:MAG: glycosyltransferase family 39 protein [Parcubacteria group bacterium]
MSIFLEKNYKLIVALTLGFMFIVSVLNAKNDSAIFDETAHIGAAYSYVTQHEIRLNPEHPPLIKDLAGLPLLFLNLNFDANQPFWAGTLPGKWDEGQWAAGRYLLYQASNNPDKIIFWARFPIILLSLLLGFFIFKWGREIAGIQAGILALLFYAFDPNILGHNHFVTTDLGIAAFMVFSFYFYLKFIKYPAWKNVIFAGIFLGLLQLAKFSFITALPIFGLITILYPLAIKITAAEKSNFIFRLKKLGEYIGKGAVVFFASLVVVWIVYAANSFNMRQDTVARVIEANFSAASAESAKDIYFNKFLHQLNANSLTRPLTEYGIGIGYVFRRVAGGNGAYFMGQVSSTAFRAYFPTVFMIKEPVPLLFLMFGALFLALFKFGRTFVKSFENFWKYTARNISHYLRIHITEFSMVLFVFLYGYLSITGNLNIGFRHLFPILPFLYILTAKNISEFLKNRQTTRGKLFFSSAVFLLVAYLIVETVAVFPNYMSYFNESVGGPKNGYRFVTDSNADWGQDLKRLRSFLDDHPDIGTIRVDYFGGGDIKTYIGDKYLMWWDSKRPVEAGWYAISTNFLMGSLYDKTKPDKESYRWLKNKKPDFQVGTSILIYNITPKEAVAANGN